MQGFQNPQGQNQRGGRQADNDLAEAGAGPDLLVERPPLFSGVAAGSRLGDSLLPLLVMPLVIPLMIAAVETTRRALGGATAVGAVGVPQWIGLLGGFDLVVGVAAFATFAFVMEEQ